MNTSVSVKIVTDSASDIPESLAAKFNISVVSLTVHFDDQEFVDRVELDAKSFVQRMQNSSVLPSTAAPSPGAFEAAFRQAHEEGFTHVLCITMSSKLSATFQAAVQAAGFMTGIIDVRVIDSQMVTVGEAIMVQRAAELAQDGHDINVIVEKIADIRSRVRLIAALDTLENLKKGGRIGKAQAFFGSILSIKPLIEIANGEVKPLGRQRTWGKALSQLVQILETQAPLESIVVGHVQAHEIDAFVDRLKSFSVDGTVPIHDVGPIIGTHGGVGLIGIAFLPSK